MQIQIIRKSMLAAATLGAAFVAMPLSTANAVPIGFSCITGNDAGNCAVGDAQLSVEITDIGGGQVLLEFMNSGPADSSIADVYLDDAVPGTIMSVADLIDADQNGGDPGVDFSMGATPPNLPGGNAVGFSATTGLTADSDPPVQPNGVNPGETLGVIFNLNLGSTFADVLADLTDGDLRIGIHVQGFSNGGSESFVNVPVPEPSAALLIGLGMAALGTRQRR